MNKDNYEPQPHGDGSVNQVGEAVSFALGGFEQPKYVGSWRIGGRFGLVVGVEHRPRWLTRKLCKYLFEWEWKDSK